MGGWVVHSFFLLSPGVIALATFFLLLFSPWAPDLTGQLHQGFRHLQAHVSPTGPTHVHSSPNCTFSSWFSPWSLCPRPHLVTGAWDIGVIHIPQPDPFNPTGHPRVNPKPFVPLPPPLSIFCSAAAPGPTLRVPHLKFERRFITIAGL